MVKKSEESIDYISPQEDPKKKKNEIKPKRIKGPSIISVLWGILWQRKEKPPEDPRLQEVPIEPEKPKKKKSKSSVDYYYMVLTWVIFLFLIWATIFKIDIASTAMGEVMPSTQIKKVQHLEGGIIKKILVKEGDKVTKGQPLVVLEATISHSDMTQLVFRIASLEIDIARLNAELNGFTPLVFSQDHEKKYPEVIRKARDYYETRKARYSNESLSHQQIVIQKEKAILETRQRVKHMQEELVLLEEQIQISEDLLKKEITNRYTHISLLREAKALKSKIAQDQLSLQQADAEYLQAKSNADRFANSYREEINKEIQATNRQIEEFEEQLSKYSDQFRRTTLTSPVDGVVRQLHVFTAGAVVKSGETVVDVVPSGDTLIINAKLPVQDIGYIRVGQKAIMRLASADAMRFDPIEGKVSFVSADAIEGQDGRSFYKVIVSTDQPYFKKGSIRFQLYPGMEVSVSILTGSRSVMSYILDPLMGYSQQALRER